MCRVRGVCEVCCIYILSVYYLKITRVSIEKFTNFGRASNYTIFFLRLSIVVLFLNYLRKIISRLFSFFVFFSFS